ncbi:MAG: polysaccharide deacetylase family protein [Burkholderiaceae bacterium]|jgi:peptidoglycan/xylan/chitin deacetylase (PgdA/CDA1 family)|nr:polysaccharide deacetylase family protein [Burkholderiaceae bacterium]
MSLLFRALTAAVAPAGERSRLSVFYFHRTPAEPDPLLPSEPDARMFDQILGWIGSQFRVLDPLEACDRLYDGTLPSRPAVITFDDGYRDNFTVAFPILQRHRMRAAFFVATAFLDGGMMFNDRVIEAVRRCRGGSISFTGAQGDPVRLPASSDLERRRAIDAILAAIKHLPPEDREEQVARIERDAGIASRAPTSVAKMMDPDQVASLHRSGMRIGGHTRTHPILVKMDDGAARAEIAGGLDDLAGIIGERPSLFAYPNGRNGTDFDARHVSMLEESGVRFAFTTHAGTATRQASKLELPRFTPWDRSRHKFGVRAWMNAFGH